MNWHGDTLDSIGHGTQFLLDPGYSAEQRQQLLNFFTGREQWDANVQAQRDQAARPTMVINRIPELVALAKIKAEEKLERPLTREETQNLILNLTARNVDHQRFWNYMFSAYVETMVTRPVAIVDSDGGVHPFPAFEAVTP